MTFNPSNAISSYLPVNFQLPTKETLLEFISKRERETANILNIKENANYENFEILTGQQFFDSNSTPTLSTPTKKRYIFRTVYNFGALPNNTTKTLAHGLTLDDGVHASTWFFTKIHATAFNPSQGAEKAISFDGTYYDIAAGAVSNPMNLFVDSTNINITTTSDRTAFTECIVTLEYMKVF